MNGYPRLNFLRTEIYLFLNNTIMNNLIILWGLNIRKDILTTSFFLNHFPNKCNTNFTYFKSSGKYSHTFKMEENGG